jgi:hypothetical protein
MGFSTKSKNPYPHSNRVGGTPPVSKRSRICAKIGKPGGFPLGKAGDWELQTLEKKLFVVFFYGCAAGAFVLSKIRKLFSLF